ncbi:MAG: hypothetical protein ACRES8_03625, partial [Nevskiaceae bacterium]
MIWLTLILTVGAGLWLGAWTSKEWGFIVGGALGYLVAQRLQLGGQIEALRRRLLELETRAGAPAAKPPAASPEPAPQPTAPRAVSAGVLP